MNSIINEDRIEDTNDLNTISSIITKNKKHFKNYPFHFMFQTRDLITKEIIEKDPESVINFFNAFKELDPLSPNLIRILFQIDNPNLLKKLIRENIKIITKILNYTKAEAYSTDDLAEDGDIDGTNEYIQYSRYCKGIETINTFIEELYPYLSTYNFPINENYMYFNRSFRKDESLLVKELKEKEISLNLLLQVLKTTNESTSGKSTLISLLDSIFQQLDQIEIKITGNEKLTDIVNFMGILSPTDALKLKNKITESISIDKDKIIEIDMLEDILKQDSIYKKYLCNSIINSLDYLRTLIYISKQYKNKIPLEENKLYQRCLDLFLINKDKSLNKKDIEETFKNIIIKITKEDSLEKMKNIWFDYFYNFLEVNTEKELILFNKLGLKIECINQYSIPEIENLEKKDYYEVFHQISKKNLEGREEFYIKSYDFISDIQNASLNTLLTFGKNATLYLIKKLNIFEIKKLLRKVDTEIIATQVKWIIKKINTKKMSEKELEELKITLRIQVMNNDLIPFIERLIKLSNLYQNKIQYKDTIEYKEAYETYKIYVKRKLSITNQRYDDKIEFIFNKLIRTEDFTKYLINISSIKQIIMLNKTENNSIEEDKILLEEIEEFNPRQYNDIRKRMLKLLSPKEKKTDIIINTLSLKVVTFLGYDLAKLLLQQKKVPYQKLSIFISGLGNKRKSEILEGFKECLKEHPNIFELSEEQLENYYSWYEYLYRNLKRKIKYDDIIKYENISNEKLLSEANYFPIIKNIHFVENENYKRNILKTGALWLEQKERMTSTIPEYQNDLENYHYEMIDMHNPDLIFLPNMVGCCMTVGGLAEADIIHAATNENGRLFGIYKNGEIIAISWVWRNNQILCFDNIEIKRDLMNQEHSKILLKILEDTANAMIEISKKNESEQESIKIVTLGRNPSDIELALKEENLLTNYTLDVFHPKNQEGLYLTDSKTTQYIIAGKYQEELNHEITIKYICPRKTPIKFDDIYKVNLENMINSIKKDNNIITPNPIYKIGYLGEDYYVGVTTKDEVDIVYKEVDPRSKIDAMSLLETLKKEEEALTKKRMQENKLIEDIINKPYCIDEEKLEELSKLIEDSTPFTMDDYYFHGSGEKNILKILIQRKISCPYQLGLRTKNHNGTYHICVTKNLNINLEAFHNYVKNNCSIVLRKDLPVIDKDLSNSNFLNPFPQENGRRTYGYHDEFHVVEQITDQYFEAVCLPTEKKEQLIFIRRVIKLLDDIDLNLPIISSTNQKIINQQLIKQYIK